MLPNSISQKEKKALSKHIIRLRADIHERTGRDFICRSFLVLEWMAQPELHLRDMATLYQEFPETHSYGPFTTYTWNHDLHSFLSLLECLGGGVLTQFMGMLSPQVTMIAALHDHEHIRKLAAERLDGREFYSALNNMAKAKIALPDIRQAVDCVSLHSQMKPVLAMSLSRYKLWDPDHNGLSDYLKHFGRIKCSRLLYFALADGAIFPLFAQAQDCRSLAQVHAIWESRERFSWHIEAVVLRCILLFLSHHGQQQALSCWISFFNETSQTWGYDGRSEGFNRDTLKMVEAFSTFGPLATKGGKN